MQEKYELKRLEKFPGRVGPLVFIILDGVGLGKQYPGNAFWLAKLNNITRWMENCKKQNLYTQLCAHGTVVGLPFDTDMGNSEVGHNAIGSGQIYNQGSTLVDEAIKSEGIFKTPAWKDVIVSTAKAGKTVHLIGLLSNGNIHSNTKQLFALLDGIVRSGVRTIRLHTLLDGRDVSNNSGLMYIFQLEAKLAELCMLGIDAKIASGGGRMYVTMDRYYSDWTIVQRGWNAHVHGIISPSDITPTYPGYFRTAQFAIETAREVFPKKLDQFNPPFVIVDAKQKPIGTIEDGDAVVNFNFRGDRAIQISEAFVKKDFTGFDRGRVPAVKYAGLLEYDSDVHMPPQYLVLPPDIQNVSGQYLCAMGVTSYALAETHKYGHVTYFWNGNRSGYIDPSLEKYEEVSSDPNAMIESRPEMKAREVTEKLISALQSQKYKFLRVNYANGDMVGHTGNIEACIKSMQVLDECLPKVVEEVERQNGIVVISADHGNVEEKLDERGNPKTSHTLNPVPFFILDKNYHSEYIISCDGFEKNKPGIANITATLIELLGFQAPAMYEKSLLKF